MSIWTITSMNLPSASTAADPEHVATCSIASCSRQCRLIRSPTEISRAGKRIQTTTYSGSESEMDSHFEEIETETIRAALEKRGFAFVEERLKEAGWRSIEGDQYTRRTAV